jgi:hypothetical protein
MPRTKQSFPRAILGMRALRLSALTYGLCFEFHEYFTII